MTAEALKQVVSVSVIEDVDESEESGAQLDLEEVLKEADSPAPDSVGEPEDQPVPEGSDGDGEQKAETEGALPGEEPDPLDQPKVQKIFHRMDVRDEYGNLRVAREGDDWEELKGILPHGDFERAIRERGRDPETVRNYRYYGRAGHHAEKLGKTKKFRQFPRTCVYPVMRDKSSWEQVLEWLLVEFENQRPTMKLVSSALERRENGGSEGDGSGVTSSPTNGSDGDEGNEGADPNGSGGSKTRKKQSNLTKALGSLRSLNTNYQACGREDRDAVCVTAWTDCAGLCLALVKAEEKAKGKKSKN